MRPPFYRSIVRLRVRPDEPAEPTAIVGPRPRGSRRPHTDAKVAAVRRLIEQTTLTYGEIAARTGVACASICRWTRDGGWRRPVFAPRATDTVPSARASAKLKARTLAARLSALSERYIRELEETPGVDLDKLSGALELLKMAKLAAMPRHRPRKRRRSTPPPLIPANAGIQELCMVSPGKTGAPLIPANAGIQEPRTHEQTALGSRFRGNERGEDVLADLRTAGVNIERAPREALADFIASRSAPRDDPELRPRGRRSKRNREHARMLERDR